MEKPVFARGGKSNFRKCAPWPSFSMSITFYFFKAWTEYSENLEQRRLLFEDRNYTGGPAFHSEKWKLSNRTDRTHVCRVTYHGFHHNICVRGDFFEETSDLCICIYCEERAIDRYHITRCKKFENKSIRRIVTEILETAKPCE